MGVVFKYAHATSATGIDHAIDNTWKELIASTSGSVNYLVIQFTYKDRTAPTHVEGDIGVGASGSEVIVAENLVASRSQVQYFPVDTFFLPINIASGSRLAIRSRDELLLGHNLSRVTITGYSQGFHNYTNVDYLGKATVNTGTANTKGSWVQVAASLSNNYDSLYVAVKHNRAAMSQGRYFVDIATGAASSEVTVLQNIQGAKSSAMDVPNPTVNNLLPVAVNSGTRLSARVQCSDTNSFITYLYGLRAPAAKPLAPIPMEISLAASGLNLLHQPMPNIGSSVESEETPAQDNTWVEVVASTSAATQYIILTLRETHLAGNNLLISLVDIGVGSAGSEVVIARELWNIKNNLNASFMSHYRLPLNIPAGSRVCIRRTTQKGVHTASLRYTMSLYGGPTYRTYSNCDMLGRVTSPSATANVYSAWLEINAAVSYDYKEIIVGHVNPFDGAQQTAYQQTDIGIGAASSEVVIMEASASGTNLNDDLTTKIHSDRLPIPIPAGSRVAARVMNTDTGTNSPMTLCVWGFRE